jgi:hypothetical protein
MYCSNRHLIGEASLHAGATLWTKATPLAAAGMDLTVGPVGQGLQSAEEWVDLSSGLGLAGILAETAGGFYAF